MITVARTRIMVAAQCTQAHKKGHISVKISGFVWNLIASLVRKLTVTINSQLSVHTRSYIVLVFVDHLKASNRIASHAEPLRVSSRVLPPREEGGTRDETLRPSAWEANNRISETINLTLAYSTSVFILHQSTITKFPFSSLLKDGAS